MITLRKDEKKAMNEDLKAIYDKDLIGKKDLVTTQGPLLFINSQCRFFKYNDLWVPTLRYILEHPETLASITIDMGAVKFVCSGADIMRPGITNIPDGIKVGEIVTIIECTHKKPLAIGQATMNSEDLQKATSGKVIKNLHFTGDKIWKLGEDT